MKRSAFLLTFLLCLCMLNVPFSAKAKTEEESQQEIRTLQKRNTQLENKLEQLTSDLKNAANQLKLLQKQITTMTTAGEDNAEEAKAARAALKDVKKQLKELLAKQSESSAVQQEQLKTQLDKVLQEQQQLETQVRHSVEEKQTLEKELKALKKKKSADRSADLKKELAALQAALEKQKTQYKANLSLLNEREQELQEARDKIRDMDKQTVPQEDLQQTEARAAELELTLTTLSSKLLKLSQENEQLKHQLSSKTPELEQNNARLRELEKKLAGAKVTIFELDRQRAELETRLSDGQANQQKSDEQTRELEKKLSEAHAKADEDNAEEAKAARAALKDVKKQFEELLAKQLENSAVQQEQLETQLNKMLQEQQQEQQQLETQVRRSVEEKQTLEKELEALKKKKPADRSADLKKELAALQAALEKQKKQYKANLSLLNEREQELREARNKIRNLNKQTFPQEDLQQTEARAAELKSTLTTLSSRLLELSQENEQLKRQLSSKTPELEQNDTRLRELEKKLAGAKVTILELDQQRAELEIRLSDGQANQQKSDEQTQELEKKLSEANARTGEDNAEEAKAARAALKDVKNQFEELLAKQLENSAVQQEQLETQLNKMLQEQQQLETQVRHSVEEKQTLEKELEALKKEKSADRSADLKKELTALQAALEKQKTQYKANLSLLNEREQELQEARNNIRDLNEQTVPQEDLQQTEARAAELESTLTALNSRLLKLSQDNEQLKRQLSSKTPELEQNNARLRESEKKLAETKATILELDRQKSELETRLSAGLADRQRSDEQTQELEKRLSEANAKILELDRQKRELETRLLDGQAQQQDAGQQKDAEILRLKDELLKAADYINNTNTQLSELQQKNTELNAQLRESQQTTANLQAQITQSSDTVQGQNQEVSRLQDQLTILQSQFQDSVQDNNSTNTQLSELQQKNTALNAQLRESQQTTANLQAQITQSSDTVQGQNQEVSRLQDQLTILQSQFQDSEQNNKVLQDEITDLDRRLTVQGSVPEEAKNRIQQLTQELQGTRIKLQQQQQLEREYPMLQQQVQHLQTQVAALEKAGENAILFEGRSEELQIAFDESRRETKSLMEQNISLQEELDNRAETYQTQGRKFQEFSQRNQELEQQYQQGLQELALKEKLLQQALLEKSVLEKALDDEGPRHDQQQIVTLQKKLQAYQASELRDAEYSRLVTDLQEKLQNTEARNSLLQKEVLELQQSSLQVPKTPAEAPAENSGQLSTLEQQIALLETELTDSRQYVQRLQQQLATADINPTSSPAISADNFLSRFFPAGLGSGGSVSVLGSSPDNSKLAYLESNEQQQRLFIFNTLSRQAIQITEWPRSADTSTSGSRFAWAFDSEHFLFATGTPGNYVLYLGNSRKLLGQAIQLHEAHIAFAWSPAQSQFAYFSGSSLIIQNLQQQTLSIQLGHQPGLEETSLAWSPDGRQIAICARQGDSFDIFLLGFANNTPSLQTLVASSSDDLLPSWSPDGRYLAFYVRADRYDTKIAVSPSDKSRAPYIVGHNASLPPAQGPRWISGTELSYVGEEHLSAAQNSVYVVNISTGQRTSVPLSMLLAR